MVGNAKRIRTCMCSSFFFYFINSIVCFVGAFTWKTKITRSRLKRTCRSFLINSWQRGGCSTVSQLRSGCQETYRRQLWKRQNYKAVTFSQDDQVRNQTHHYMDLMKWVNSFKWTGQRQQMSMPMHTSSSRPSSLCPLPPPSTRCWSPHNHRHFRKKIGSIAVFGSQARLKALFCPPVWAEWRYFKGWVCRNNVTGCCLSWIMFSSPYSLLLWWHYRARVSGDVGRCVCAGHRPDSITRYWRKSAAL